MQCVKQLLEGESEDMAGKVALFILFYYFVSLNLYPIFPRQQSPPRAVKYTNGTILRGSPQEVAL